MKEIISVIRKQVFRAHLPSQTTTYTWVQTGTLGPKEQISRFLNNITDGTAGCVSDGSAKLGQTATAFTAMSHDDSEPAFQGSFPIPGRYKEQDAYRSELAGLLGIMMTVNFLCIPYNVQKCKVTVGCDNKSALWTSFKTDYININRSSRDLLQAIHFQRDISTVEWVPRHVK